MLESKSEHIAILDSYHVITCIASVTTSNPNPNQTVVMLIVAITKNKNLNHMCPSKWYDPCTSTSK